MKAIVIVAASTLSTLPTLHPTHSPHSPPSPLSTLPTLPILHPPHSPPYLYVCTASFSFPRPFPRKEHRNYYNQVSNEESIYASLQEVTQ